MATHDAAVDEARARHRLYALLGRLLVEGVTDETAPVVRSLPALAALAPEDAAAADRIAAAHYAALQLEVVPYESVLLHPEGRLGGPPATEVRQFCARLGLTAPRADVEPDHVGLELAVLAHLCAAELEALQDDATDAVVGVRDAQRQFLDAHLLRWLPVLAGAVAELEGNPWAAATGLALELAADHRASLGGDVERWALPEPPKLLDDPRTGLRDVARTLARAAEGGWVCSRAALRRVGAQVELGTGFGDRRQQLVTLVGGAAEAERLPELVWALGAELDRVDQQLQVAVDLHLEDHVRPWRARIGWTRTQLERLGEAALELANA
jgi:TorA maturation chaperone TorD